MVPKIQAIKIIFLNESCYNKRSFTPRFKTKVVLKLLRKEKELIQLLNEHETASNVLHTKPSVWGTGGFVATFQAKGYVYWL
jgi:hypothetical protein